MTKDKPLKNVGTNVVESVRKRRKLLTRTSNLTFPEIPGYVTRLVLVDDPKMIGRVSQFEEDLAYTPVHPSEVGLDSSESTVTRPAGGGKTFLLMKTPVEEYNAAKLEKRKMNETKTKKETETRVDGQFGSFSQTIEH